jgi:4-carboxymuconolactone decarboxylase
MARVKLLSDADCLGQGELLERNRGARRGVIINVYRLLLHAPALAGVWFDLINAVRWKTGLAGRLREILIIRVGIVTKVQYIINTHVQNIAEQEGLPKAECAALEDWTAATSFSPAERAALQYADEMTRNITVSDATFAELRGHFSEKEIVEMSVLVGTYNMHARVLAALEIDPQPTADAQNQAQSQQ